MVFGYQFNSLAIGWLSSPIRGKDYVSVSLPVLAVALNVSS